MVVGISNKRRIFPIAQIASGQAILHFETKEHRQHLLQQSRLLKDTNLWNVEELALAQLKVEGKELKKVRHACEAKKWAVYHGGKTITQEFCSPNPMSYAIETPSTC